MKAITLHQPWATLVAIGSKQFETRSWKTPYRGLIAIHASKNRGHLKWLKGSLLGSYLRKAGELPLGCVVAIARLTTIYTTESALDRYIISPLERELGDYSPGRFAWRLDDIKPVVSVAAKGALGIWEWEQPMTSNPLSDSQTHEARPAIKEGAEK